MERDEGDGTTSISLSHDIRDVLEEFRALGESFEFAPLFPWFAPIVIQHQIKPNGFEPRFLAHLAYEGWFLFCCRGLTPKLHRHKMLLDLQTWEPRSWLQTAKSAHHKTFGIEINALQKRLTHVLSRKNEFVFRVADNFREVLDRTNQFHRARMGETWIEPPLVEAMTELAHEPVSVGESQFAVMAWELRRGDDIVAADVGYRVGGIYSSMSGFSDRRFPSIGIVQLLAQLEVMRDRGLALWDLGMPMPYKSALGAQALATDEWLPRFRQHRKARATLSFAPFYLHQSKALQYLRSCPNAPQ